MTTGKLGDQANRFAKTNCQVDRYRSIPWAYEPLIQVMPTGYSFFDVRNSTSEDQAHCQVTPEKDSSTGEVQHHNLRPTRLTLGEHPTPHCPALRRASSSFPGSGEEFKGALLTAAGRFSFLPWEPKRISTLKEPSPGGGSWEHNQRTGIKMVEWIGRHAS